MDAHAVRPLTDGTPPRRGAALALGPGVTDRLAEAHALGLDRIRLDVPWPRAQPRDAALDGGVFEEVHIAATEARTLGLEVWLRIAPPEFPRWFDDEGGFADRRLAARVWPRWVEAVAERLGPVASGWVPFEAPFGLSVRLAPTDSRRRGEVLDHLVVAWRDAWRILRGGAPVATSLDVAAERPTDESPAVLDEARRREQCRWDLWLDGLRDGVVRIPGRVDRVLDDLAGACDVLGVALAVDADGTVGGHVTGGLEAVLHRLADRGPDRPLAVTLRLEATGRDERAEALGRVWRAAVAAADDLALTSVTTLGLDGWR